MCAKAKADSSYPTKSYNQWLVGGASAESMTRVAVECGLDTSTAATVMEVYESETDEIVRRFLAHKLSFPACIAALDAALTRFIPRLTAENITRLRIVMLANNEIVMKEVERRGSPPIRLV
jgi:hypothetical protein